MAENVIKISLIIIFYAIARSRHFFICMFFKGLNSKVYLKMLPNAVQCSSQHQW